MSTTTTTDTAHLDTIVAWSDAASADLALVEVMQWRGTRDALIHRAVTVGRAEQKAMLARLHEFVGRHSPDALRTPEAIGSLLATIALLTWLDGDADAALQWLAEAPRGHRMAELLVAVIGVGIPAEKWAAGFAQVSEAECLAFADQERKAAARA